MYFDHFIKKTLKKYVSNHSREIEKLKNEKLYNQCPFCQLSFDKKQSLSKHLEAKHDKKFKQVFEKCKSKKKKVSKNCPMCPKILYSSLARHLSHQHKVLDWKIEVA